MFIFRFIIRFLFCGCPLDRSTVNMLCGRISTLEASIVYSCIPIDDTETIVFCSFRCCVTARCLFHNAGNAYYDTFLE